MLRFEQEQATRQVIEMGSHESKEPGTSVIVKSTGDDQREPLPMVAPTQSVTTHPKEICILPNCYEAVGGDWITMCAAHGICIHVVLAMLPYLTQRIRASLLWKNYLQNITGCSRQWDDGEEWHQSPPPLIMNSPSLPLLYRLPLPSSPLHPPPSSPHVSQHSIIHTFKHKEKNWKKLQGKPILEYILAMIVPTAASGTECLGFKLYAKRFTCLVLS